MIVTQCTMLDRIDVNIEKTSHNVKEALIELGIAEKAQKVSCFVVLVILLGIFLLMYSCWSCVCYKCSSCKVWTEICFSLNIVINNLSKPMQLSYKLDQS
jgi:hypothetical protein